MKEGSSQRERGRERDFRSVWNEDAQARSSTLHRRVRGGGGKKRTDEI